MPLLAWLAAASAVFALNGPGIPGGMVATDYSVSGGPSAGIDDITYSTTVLVEPTRSSDHYFWADQFSFTGGHVGYIGLQPRPDSGGTPQGAAYFSVFGAGVTTTDPNCSAGADGGSGWSCHVAFAYQLGHTYHLNVTRSGPDTWTGSVADAADGARTHIATWTVPSGWGALGAASGAFTEYYSKLPNGCADLPYALVVNGAPVAEHGTVRGAITGAHTYGGTSGAYVDCSSSQYAAAWVDGAGAHSETGLGHKPGGTMATASRSAAPATKVTSGSASADATSSSPSSVPAAGVASGTKAAPSTAPVADQASPAGTGGSGDGGGLVLPLAVGAFAAALVGWYAVRARRNSGRRRA